MKRKALMAIGMLACGLSVAQETGQVVSSTPVVQQVAVPRQICSNESIAVPAPRSGAGAALGAIAGGAMGNAVGHGSGRAAATMIGILGGAVLGDRIEGQGDTQYQTVQNCTSHNVFENRVSHYNVVYEYAGRQYAAQMPYDPGPTVQLQITPVNAAPPAATAPQAAYVQPLQPQQAYYSQPAFVAVVPPVYPRYYVPPYLPPIGVNLQFGYGNHRRHNHGWR